MCLSLRIRRSILVLACAALVPSALAHAQALDTPFNPGAGTAVYALALQPDGKILVGGVFTTIGGGGIGLTTRNRLARLNTDGSVDLTFDPGANQPIYAMSVQPDGKILVGGNITTLGGGGTGTTSRGRIGRLNADGSLDVSFNPGANGEVYALVVQPDGKILVGGNFSALGGGGTTVRQHIGRLNSDGSVDVAFNPGANGAVNAIALQPNGQILVGGAFTTLGGGGTGVNARSNIGRLNGDGSIDTMDPGASAAVTAIAVQADDKILVGGSFTTLGGGGTGVTARSRIGRLNSNGSIDTPFDPGASTIVHSFAVQTDGKILVSGQFVFLGGGGTGVTARSGIGRLNADGSLDTGFNPGANDTVFAIVLQADGAVLVGGNFTLLGGGGAGTTTRQHIGRLTNSGVAVQTLVVSGGGSIVTWSRSGVGPEVWRVTFESSANGVTYGSLGTVARIGGGWQLTGVSVPSNVYVRARGYYATARSNGSASIAEALLSPPAGLTVSPTVLNFGATKNGAGGALVSVTPAQDVTVGFTGSAPTWTAAADQPWVQITNGTAIVGAKKFTVAIVNPGNVIGGSTSLTSTITVSSPTAASVTIAVSLAVQQVTGSSASAFGQVDTPTQNAAGVQGAIPMTGWALDDVGVSAINVYRTCLGFDNPAACQVVGGNNVVFVGAAAFLAGARPDVEAALPSYPQAYRAGWGMQILSNMLPNVPGSLGQGGQGSLTLYAFATDVEGHVTLLGRSLGDSTPTAITMDNNNIAKPFGTIDTPSLGQTISGGFTNFGWLLTPDINTVIDGADIFVPLNGSTMVVYIDGVGVATAGYNQCRGTVGTPPPGGVYCNDDVSNIFGNPTPQAPGTTRVANATKFRNLDAARGPIGFYTIDTTTLVNGLHTIAWGVADSAGRGEGVGSRFFTVLNGGAFGPGFSGEAGPNGLANGPSEEELLAAPAQRRGDASALDAFRPSGRAMTIRTGYDPRAVAKELPRGSDGARGVTIPVTGRVELSLAGAVTGGYLVTNGELRDLPVGSHLDLATGVFVWAPPPGYFGAYRLAFLVGNERVLVDVTVQ